MRRVLEFLRWRSHWWTERRTTHTNIQDLSILEGLQAYALRQAGLQADLATSFRTKFTAPLNDAIQELMANLDQGEQADERHEEGGEWEAEEEGLQTDSEDEYD